MMEAELKKRRQTPGTAEWYSSKAKTIVGIPEDGTNSDLSFSVKSAADASKQIITIRQMQKELRLLKREINLKIKESQLYQERPSYTRVLKEIDSLLLKLDELKLILEKTVRQMNNKKETSTRVSAPTLAATIDNLQSLIAKRKRWDREIALWSDSRVMQIEQHRKLAQTLEDFRLVEKELNEFITEIEQKKRELDQMSLERENIFESLDPSLVNELEQHYQEWIHSDEKTRSSMDSQINLIYRVLGENDTYIQAELSKMVSAPDVSKTSISEQQISHKQVEQSPSLQDALDELNSLVGLETVKKDVAELINFLKVQRLRKAKNLPTTPIVLHQVFYGNPGTGKTTVARLLSQIFKSMSLLSKGHLIETDRSGLVAGYVGQTALKVTDVVNKALGGILFIDEAYSLAGQDNDFGQEAIETLLKQMEDHRDDLVVIVAGYTDRMNEFISSNPGLRSRFTRYLRFDDYTPLQLVAIFESFCAKSGYHLSLTAKEKLQSVFSSVYANRDKTFGNARSARNLFERTISNQANRVVTIPNANPQIFSTVDAVDIPDQVTDILI